MSCSHDELVAKSQFKACKLVGYSRQQFYEIRRNFQTPAFAGAGAMAPPG